MRSRAIAEAVSPISEAQVALQTKIMEMADKPSKDAIGEKVAPHLDPLLQTVFGPVNEAFKMIQKHRLTILYFGKRVVMSPRRPSKLVVKWCLLDAGA